MARILPLFSLVFCIYEAMHQGTMKNSAYANRPMQSFLQTCAILFADLIIDKPVFRMYNTYNFIYCSSAACFALKLAENSESGQNPERYRHCMRGGTARDESQSLGLFPEKAVRKAYDTRVRRPA